MTTDAERFNAAVGKQMRAEISAGKYSVAGMARALGLSRSALINYLDGVRDIPVPAAYQVCAVLGILPHTLVKRAEERLDSEDQSTPARSTARKSKLDEIASRKLRPAKRDS